MFVKNELNNQIIKRFKNKKTIQITYILYTASMWSCEGLYRIIENNPRFKQTILVAKKKDSSSAEEEKTYNILKEQGYNVLLSSHKNGREIISSSDIVIYTYPFAIEPKFADFPNLKLNHLTMYVSYGFYLSKNEDKYNNFHHLNSWRFITDTLVYKQLMAEHCFIGDSHIRYFGYPKMDIYFTKKYDSCNRWKEKDNKKYFRILYTPHHSIDYADGRNKFATFDSNYIAVLELAKKYADCTTWIVKPHPLLAKKTAKVGLFDSEDGYNSYLDEWRKLDNADVVETGTYDDLFATSDAIINDSVSFVAEYQYAHKPMLFLESGVQNFNEAADAIYETLYKCKGDDIDGIERFIKEVVIEQKDTLQEQREEMFRKCLDYYSQNGQKLACEAIYEDIIDAVGE